MPIVAEPEQISEPPSPEPVAEVAAPVAEPVVERTVDTLPSGIIPVFPEPEPVYLEPVAEALLEPPSEAEAASTEVVALEEPPAPAPMDVEPEPEPQPEPERAPSVSETMLRWPTASSIPKLQEDGEQTDSGEPATSIIPAWQPAEMPSESRRTVSLSAMPPEAIAAGETFIAKLSFESGPFAGRIVALPNQMVTVGRAPDNDVVVGDPATSGRHGRIEMRAGVFWISDLGSTNGTLVNGEPVIEKELSDGDLIAIGQNTIRFSLE
jgi:hypothetical protein